jgi:hypothetical protein
MTSFSAPNVTTYLPKFILFKLFFTERGRIGTVYELLKEKSLCSVDLVNPDDERILENKKQRDKGEWEQT